MSISLVLSHPRITHFYAAHPYFSVETMNLWFIDILEKIVDRHPIPTPTTLVPAVDVKTSFHQTELSTALSSLKETVSLFHKTVLCQWITAKTQYIHDFQSVMECSEFDHATDVLFKNNERLVEKMHSIMGDISKLRSSVPYEKIAQSIKQFHLIINANIDSIIVKRQTCTDLSQLTHLFTTNFEINAAHMIQTIQQWLGEFIAAKEKHVDTVITDPSVSSDYNRALYDLHDSLHHLKQKGVGTVDPETTEFDLLVAKFYSTASVAKESESAILLAREKKTPIYIEHRAIKDRNVRADESKRFVQTTLEHACHGILVSQWTGVTSKPHLHIEIHNHRVVVYVHQLAYSMEKLQMAVDIIDSLSAKLDEYYASGDNKWMIPKDILDEINREYQMFICQKETILGFLKESHKKLLSQIDDIQFHSLDKFLSTRYSSCKKQGFVCDLCNTFTVNTLKGLAAHKRGCQRKINGGGGEAMAASIMVSKSIHLPEKKIVHNEFCQRIESAMESTV